MTEQLQELLNTSQISGPEIVDLLSSYCKLVETKLLSQEEFNIVLDKLGIKQDGNTFILNEDMSYTFN